MSQIRTVYSLKELHDYLKNHPLKHRHLVCIDLDLTVVRPDFQNPEKDVLIEPEETKKLFDMFKAHGIFYTFVTARFYDTVCNAKKRKLSDIKENLFATIFPIFEELGIDISEFKNANDDEFYIIRNHNNRCVGIIYKGVIFGDKKGEIIKHYKKDFKLNENYPHTIFIDDHDGYIRNVAKHVPDALILKREIMDEN